MPVGYPWSRATEPSRYSYLLCSPFCPQYRTSPVPSGQHIVISFPSPSALHLHATTMFSLSLSLSPLDKKCSGDRSKVAAFSCKAVCVRRKRLHRLSRLSAQLLICLCAEQRICLSLTTVKCSKLKRWITATRVLA